MRVKIIAMGRLRKSPELELIQDYLKRFERTSRALSLGPAEIIELEDKKNSGKVAEAALLTRAIPTSAYVIALDERGRVIGSPDFAKHLGKVRDQGAGDLVFLIGGADGLDPDLVARADYVLSFGSMVWPHMLVRVMLAEQLYRAASILSGGPYHRV